METKTIREAEEFVQDAVSHLSNAKSAYLQSRGWKRIFLNKIECVFWSRQLDDGREIVLNDTDVAVTIQTRFDSIL